MAITASIFMSPSTVPYNRPSHASVVMANTGGSDVTIQTLQPLVNTGGGENTGIGLGAWAPGIKPIVVPAGNSVITTFEVLPFSPQVAGPSTQPTTYSVTCVVTTSDGSVTSPTPATLTVTPITAN